MEENFAESQIADTGVEIKSQRLRGQTIFFGVCGSIGAVDAVRQIRELRRHSATVRPILTESGARFVTPLSLQWASQNPCLTELGPEAEHLAPVSAMIICPATWNALVQLSLGSAYDTLTTCAAIQIARRNPIFIVPTLNAEFLQHPRYNETIEQLQAFPGVKIYTNSLEEGRMKMPEPASTAEAFCAWFEKSAH